MQGNVARRRRWIRYLACGVVCFLVVFALSIEVAFRFTVWTSRREGLLHAPDMPDLQKILPFDRDLMWPPLPNLHDFRVETMTVGIVSTAVPQTFRVSTNSHGLRGAALAPSGTRKRILAVGDSTTFGLGVNDEEAWPAQLEQLLNAGSPKPQYEVLNAGVTGYTAFQCLQYLLKKGFDLAPDLVVLTSGNNGCDTWRALSDPEEAERIRKLDPSRWGSVGYRVLRLMGAGRRARLPGKHKVRLSLEDYADILTRIHKEAHGRGIPVVYVLWPWESQFGEAGGSGQPPHPVADYHHVLKRTCSSLGIPLVDLEARWRGGPISFYLDNVHVDAAGCQDVAEAVAKILPLALPNQPVGEVPSSRAARPNP